VKLGDKKVRLLKELEISEVSLVTSAANEGAKVMIWKNHIEKVQHNNLRMKLINELIKAIKLLAREKGISQLEASKLILESDTGKNILETINTMKRREKIMYTSVGEIAEAMKKGEIKSQEDALKAFDEFVEGEVKKSDYQMDVNQARLMKMTGPGWDAYYNAFMNLPETVEAGQAIEKQQRTADNVSKVIESMAKELVQKSSGMTKEKAFMEVLKRNPELEGAYRTATGT